jgi:hypothetical protein
VYRAHVEATFESAHKSGPKGHKCAGTNPGIPSDIAAGIMEGLIQAPEVEQVERRLIFSSIASQIDNLFDYHGHSWLCEIEWDYSEQVIDENFWGPDFGKVKDLIRQLDHHNLNLMFEQPTAEFLAAHLYHQFEVVFGFRPAFVKLHEGRGNTMVYSGE